MKTQNIILLILVLLFSNCKKEEPKPKDCTDNTFCVLSKMPLISQSSMALPGIIRKLSGKKVYMDTGWCAPTSVTMGIAGLVRETSNRVKFNNNFDQFRNFSKKNTIFTRTKQYGPSIYKVGEDMGTMWEAGGTYSHLKSLAIMNYEKKIDARGYHKGFRSMSVRTWNPTTNQDIIDIFQQRKPFMAVSFGTYKPGEKASDPWQREGGHALVINGYEDGYLKIYDPWGKIYNVNLVKRTDKVLKNRTEVRHVSGSWGFVHSYSGRKTKVVFDGYDYLYVHK